jgi:hypothetical protein
MPALLLHFTLAQETLALPDVPREIAEACNEERGAFLLGAVLPDLPYHAHFWRQVARHFLRRPYLLTEWGDLMHTRGTGRLAVAILCHLRRSHLQPAEERKVMALAAGYLSHLAVDRAAHPAINALVSRHLTASEAPSALHARLERIQSLFYHRDRLGHDIAGSPFPRKAVLEMAGTGLLRPTLETPLWNAFRAASLETHGRAPSPALLREWLAGVTAYGCLMSSPLGRTERLKGDLAALRSTFYQGPSTDLRSPLAQGMELTLEYWHAALEVLRADRVTEEVRQCFLARVPDVDLGTGA